MGEKGEGSGGEGGGKWGERGRELGMGYPPVHPLVHVFAVIISKYATKIIGLQNRQVGCVNGTQDQKQLTFNKIKPAQQ